MTLLRWNSPFSTPVSVCIKCLRSSDLHHMYLKILPSDHLSLDKLFFRYDDAARSLHFLSRCPMWNSCCSLSFPWVLLLRCDDEHMDPFHQGLLTFSTLPKWLPWNRRMLWKTRGRVRERETWALSVSLSLIMLPDHYRHLRCVCGHVHTHTTTPGKPRTG